MMRRVLAIAWAIFCVIIAANAALQMLLTFAPSHGRVGDVAAAELAGMERARNVWIGGVWMASGVLAISGIVTVVLAWRRR